jgi:hypothetical protein
MPASTYLSNPSVKVGAAIGTIVDITDQVSAATLTVTAEALEDTAFGQTSRTMTAGLFSNSLTLTVYASYAASESYAVLAPLLGTKCTIKVNPTSAADSATNPGFILTDTYLASIPVVNAALGELSTYELEFQGGTYSVDVTAP